MSREIIIRDARTRRETGSYMRVELLNLRLNGSGPHLFGCIHNTNTHTYTCV